MLKRYPDLPVGGLIREKLADHLGRQNLEGELAFFKDAGNFERPYGYAWLLKLHAELASWKDPEATRWADNVAPLAKHSRRRSARLPRRPRSPQPRREPAEQRVLAWPAARLRRGHPRDATMGRAASETARRLFLADTNCATENEAATPEMVSPCLAEASVMSRVLDQPAFLAWFDKFMPPAFSPKFKPLTTVSLDAAPPAAAVAAVDAWAGTTTDSPLPAASRRAPPPLAADTGPRAAAPNSAVSKDDRSTGGCRGPSRRWRRARRPSRESQGNVDRPGVHASGCLHPHRGGASCRRRPRSRVPPAGLDPRANGTAGAGGPGGIRRALARDVRDLVS